MELNTITQGDCLETLKTLPGQSVDTHVTSPPYYMPHDYGIAGNIGLEETPDLYVAKLLAVFGEVRRVLKDEGTLWVNIGDGYNGSGKNRGNTRPLSDK
jgi:DNA modification methylase